MIDLLSWPSFDYIPVYLVLWPVSVYCWAKYTPWKNQGLSSASHMHTHTPHADDDDDDVNLHFKFTACAVTQSY